MRVIAGSARRLLLKCPEGLDTRPTSDKVKETLFNILMPEIYSDTRFLDLFSGSGAIAIEALSRGAEYAVLVEKNRNAIKCINDNLSVTRFSEKAKVMSMDVLSALHQLEGREHFDIIFMDPPYGNEYERTVLEYLAGSKLAENSLVVIEADVDTDFDYVNELPYEIIKYKKYKNNCHLFLRRS